MNYILFLLFFSITLFAKQNYTIEPKGDIQLRYEIRDKEYSPLGAKTYSEDKINYHDYVIGGLLGVQIFNDNYKFNVKGYGTLRLQKKDNDNRKNESYYYNNKQNEFFYLGELNVKKSFNNHSITLGRQSYNTPLVNSNVRITQNSYEGVNYTLKKDQLILKSLYFNKIASSTLANNVPFNHKFGFLGYGLGYNTSGFNDLSKHIINKDLSTNGALDLSIFYGEKEKFVFFENLYIDNFFNNTNLAFAYHKNNFYFKVGAIYQNSVGDKHVENNIESSQKNKKLQAQHYHARMQYRNNDFRVTYTVAHTPYNKSNIYNGTFFSPFSNKLSWVRGVNTAHSLLADTTSQKISVSKKLDIYKVPTKIIVAYVKYDIGENNGILSQSLDTNERYIHIKSYLSKNINTKIQYSQTRNTNQIIQKSNNTKISLEYKF